MLSIHVSASSSLILPGCCSFSYTLVAASSKTESRCSTIYELNRLVNAVPRWRFYGCCGFTIKHPAVASCPPQPWRRRMSKADTIRVSRVGRSRRRHWPTRRATDLLVAQTPRLCLRGNLWLAFRVRHCPNLWARAGFRNSR
jgi:hypothetical protein